MTEEQSADMSDGYWMTYDELAAFRRVDRASAIKLANRRGWPKQPNNTGLLRVLVPSDWHDRMQARRDRHEDKSAPVAIDTSSFAAALDAVIKPYAEFVEREREVFTGGIVEIRAMAKALEEAQDARIVDLEAKLESERTTRMEAERLVSELTARVQALSALLAAQAKPRRWLSWRKAGRTASTDEPAKLDAPKPSDQH